MKLHKLAIILVAAFTSQQALSHGAWLAERLDAPTIVYGEDAKDNAYDPNKITYAQAFDKDGNVTFAFIQKNTDNVSFGKDSDFTSAAFVLTNGFYTKTKENGYIKKPQNEVDKNLTIIKSLYSVKIGLSVIGDGKLPSIKSLNKLPLVVYPNTDLSNIKQGDDITVTVYYKGKPVKGVSVNSEYITSKEKFETDSNGQVTFKVRNSGLNVIKAGYKVDTEGDMKEKAQYFSYSSTLSFVIKDVDDH